MESLGVSWDFVRVESSFSSEAKISLRKRHTYIKIAFGHQCACSWIAEFYSRCQEASKHHDSYTEFPESRTPNDVIIYSLARVAAWREEKLLGGIYFANPHTLFKLLLTLWYGVSPGPCNVLKIIYLQYSLFIGCSCQKFCHYQHKCKGRNKPKQWGSSSTNLCLLSLKALHSLLWGFGERWDAKDQGWE